jgi:uncharacterized alpha-E superfamily protein
MLLSRVADALYWISRYLERAEHTARVVDVALELALDRAATPRHHAVDRLYQSLHVPGSETLPLGALVNRAMFDASDRSSVAACVLAARDNARQVREEISSDMWEQLNDLFLALQRIRQDAANSGRTHHVSRMVIQGVHLFAGVTDATMGHGEGWQYLQAGRFLERASSAAALLDAFMVDRVDDGWVRAALDQADWVALLGACSALEGYCRRYTAEVRAERVVEFLLLDPDCPRSIRFAATRLEGALSAIARYSGRGGGRAERISGRLRASLDYGQIDEVLSEDPHTYLAAVSRQCAQIHGALYQSCIAYPIESALAAS